MPPTRSFHRLFARRFTTQGRLLFGWYATCPDTVKELPLRWNSGAKIHWCCRSLPTSKASKAYPIPNPMPSGMPSFGKSLTPALISSFAIARHSIRPAPHQPRSSPPHIHCAQAPPSIRQNSPTRSPTTTTNGSQSFRLAVSLHCAAASSMCFHGRQSPRYGSNFSTMKSNRSVNSTSIVRHQLANLMRRKSHCPSLPPTRPLPFTGALAIS